MSPHFLCYSCEHANQCEQNATKCPFCSSSNGRVITDEEFRKQYKNGVIRLIDPKTGKPFKKT